MPPVAQIASLSAEESVVGAILVHPRKLEEVSGVVAPPDFYFPAPRALFDAIVQLGADSHPVDVVTVLERMRSLDSLRLLSSLGGADYLTELMAKVVTVENVAHHAQIVATKARRRRVRDQLRELADAGGDETTDDATYLQAVEQGTIAISRGAPDAGAIVSVKVVAEQWYDNYKLAAAGAEDGKPQRFVPTGVRRFDDQTGGMCAGEVHTIAARPSRGKTSLMDFIIRAACIEDVPVLCASYEMPPKHLFARTVSAESSVDGLRLRVPRTELRSMTRVSSAVSRIVQWPLDYICRPDMTVEQFRAHARRWRREHDDENALITIDYVQIVKAGMLGKGVTREREVSHVCTEIDAMALELECAVLMLAQINREAEKRGGKPKMADLRESGQIEAVSDVVWGIHMPELDEMAEDPKIEQPVKTIAWICGLKGRSVGAASFRMVYEPPYTRFSNPEDER